MQHVTVVIANYNYGQWVLNALDSVVAQDYPEKSIAITDDASTDGSFGIINDKIENKKSVYTKTGDSLVIGTYKGIPITLTGLIKNVKQAKARNIGIKHYWGRAEYFAILDADDYWLPGKLSKSIAILNDDKKVGAVYTDYDIFHTAKDLYIKEFKEPYSRDVLFDRCIVHSGCVISKAALEKVGTFDVELPPCEDYDLWLRISEHFVIYHIPETLVVVRVTGQNSTFTVPNEIWVKQHQRIREKWKKKWK